MKIVSIAEAKARLSSYVRATEEGPVILTRNGSPVAVLLPAGDPEELERLLLAYSPRFQALLATARRQLDQSEGCAHGDFWEKVENSPQS